MRDTGTSALPTERADRGLPVVAPFAATLFASAALMFVVEPMFGKLVLPRLGGSPSVWNTCMVFYQVVLLAGYAWAHLLSTRCSYRVQLVAQLALLGLACLLLPVGFPDAWQAPVDSSPVPFLLGALAVGVGVPFFALATTSPLLQSWFARTGHPTAQDPYYLYAASNVGSILALLAYPLIIEPGSTLGTQRRVWSAGFALLILLTIACGVLARRPALASAARATPRTAPIPWTRRGRWLALAAVPSSLMLAVTTYASTDIAAVPLLWTVPLALYLLSFVLAFARRRLVPARLARGLMTGLVIPLILVLALGINRPVSVLLPLHAAALLVIALVLHTALADDRPDATRLTEFYLWVAAGGALGGLFNSILAPLLFNTVAEYPLAVVAASLLAHGSRPASGPWARIGLLAGLLAGVATGMVLALQGSDHLHTALPVALVILYFAFALAVRANQVRAVVVCVWLAGLLVPRRDRELLFADRTFFGVLRVSENPRDRQHVLTHGTTLHGAQSTEPALRREPLEYYHRAGPIGQLFAANNNSLTNARIGVVGLGAGALAAYARPGQQWTFYELDPMVERIARDPRLFTYLPDCGALCDVVLGDARLSLARERGPRYRLLILDAFSSDAIPVHLLTREAFAVYLARLQPDGILAIHISNLHLDLAPVVGRVAAASGLAAVWQDFVASTPDHALVASSWVALARSPATLAPLAADPRWRTLEPPAGGRIWTDDYSNIVGALRFRNR